MVHKCIVAIGEYLWDCHKDYRVPGGAPANALFHASKFGYDGVLITALGQDADGDALFKEIEGKGLDLTKVQRIPELPTGTVDIDEQDLNDPKYDYGNELELLYFDTDDSPCQSTQGFHKAVSVYDELGHLLEKRFYDTNNIPCMKDGQYTRWESTFDDKGNILTITFYDIDVNIVVL